MFGGRPTDTRPATYFDQRRVMEDQPLAASADALSLNSSHSRSTDDGSSKKPPLAGRDRIGRSGICYSARLAGASPRLASSGQARGCACS